jgi:hypothetical protein
LSAAYSFGYFRKKFPCSACAPFTLA